MSDFPLGYKIIPSVSWAYLSSLLMIALYFKFNRVWSVRNLDLLLIVLIAPGLLMVTDGALQRKKIEDQNRSTVIASAGDEATENEATSSEQTALPEQAAANMADVQAANVAGDSPSIDLTQLTGINSSAELLHAVRQERNGYVILFIVAGLFATRMLIDPMMVRRPLLEPNLSIGGLTFLGASLLLFLFVNVVISKPTIEDLQVSQEGINLLERRPNDKPVDEAMRHGPGYGPVYVLPWMATFAASDQVLDVGHDQATKEENRFVLVTKLMAIVCQFAVVAGLFYIGYFHFDNARMGIGIAVLYLMLPYTAEMTGRVVHILPAALLVWAIAFYRRPWLSGIFVGMATGVFYYPLFLLPLWISFYWRRGRWRFISGVFTMIAVLAFSLIFVSTDASHYLEQLVRMFGIWYPRMDNLQGIWSLGWDSIYRLPILVGFGVVSFAFILWPAQKNLGTLICCSCALMAIVQFWHGYGGGLLIGWYLPLGLLTFFRPNLEDRVALTALSRGKRKNKNRSDENILNAA
jgi:hypothetical protein